MVDRFLVAGCGVDRYIVGKDISKEEADHLVQVWYNFAFWIPPGKRAQQHPLKGEEKEGSEKTKNGQLPLTLRDETPLWCQGGTWEGEPTNVTREFAMNTNTALFIAVLNLEVDSEEYAHANNIHPPNIPSIPSRVLLDEARKIVRDTSTRANFIIENVTSGGTCRFDENTLDYLSPDYEILGIRPRRGLYHGHDLATHVKKSKTAMLPSGAIFPRMMSAGYYIILKPLEQGAYKMNLSGDAPFYGGSQKKRFRIGVDFKITVK
jgi:hypothetical protein